MMQFILRPMLTKSREIDFPTDLHFTRICIMMRISNWFFILILAFATLGFQGEIQKKVTVDTVTIVRPKNATLPERLAVKEIRRYLYLRTGKLMPITQGNRKLPSKTALIVVGQKDRGIIKVLVDKDAKLKSCVASLESQQYQLKTLTFQSQKVVLITGGDSLGTLYAAYRFVEHLGVRFYLHGDVIPDERIALKIPNLDEKGKPLFVLRGILPFHDFPEGPDWWNTDEYKAVIGQLAKMRMNFIGLHTYPQGRVGPEPTVWIGMASDLNKDGTVNFSYPSRYFTTSNPTGSWGYNPEKTGDYAFGAAQMFERDDYGADCMRHMNPWPKLSKQKANELFNCVGKMLRGAFKYAHAIGVKTCVGTETPLAIPNIVKEHIKAMGKNPSDPAVIREIYQGIFQRINRAYPLDYYWLWTPENWNWKGVKDEQVEATLVDLQSAIAAAKKIKAPFTLATCGWVLGPPKDRALFDKFLPQKMPLSCINRNVGFATLEPAFARVKDRPKWAIPWLEDDPALTIPQLWVGRVRRDAADALAYGCTGLMGIHWRTRIIGPNVSALAHAAWQQSNWNPDFGKNVELADIKTRPRNLPVNDFYADWALTQFGPEVAVPMAKLFASLDGQALTIGKKRRGNLPRPAAWVSGPGGIKPDKRKWEQVKKEYSFVDEMATLRSQVKGPGNLERFDYWLNNFRYLRAVGQVSCTWGRFKEAMRKVKDQKIPDAQKRLAQEIALPIRIELVKQVANAQRFLLAAVTTSGELGNVANWQQHLMNILITKPGKELANILGENLPSEAMPSKEYDGQPRIIVPTVRSSLMAGEGLTLKIIILAHNPPSNAALYWRPMAKGNFKRIALAHIARGVYLVKIPANRIKNDLEYYIKANLGSGRQITFPATAPYINQTLVVMNVN